jgi:F-type H+-transporting ATPase subunit epsilon
MADLVHFELVAPERLLMSADVESVVVPGLEGDFGVLPGHARLISTVRPGLVVVFRDGKPAERIFVEGGFAEVTPEGCVVLAERATLVGEIERSQAETALSDAREALGEAKDDAAKAETQRVLAIAEARLAALDSTTYS